MPVEDGSTALHPVCPAGMQTVMKVKYPECLHCPFIESRLYCRQSDSYSVGQYFQPSASVW